MLAERSGLRIHEVPVDWIDDPDSRVDIVATAIADLKGIARLLKGFGTGEIPVQAVGAQFGNRAGAPRSLLNQSVRFAAIGIASTLAYLTLFVALRPIGAQAANLVALLLTAIVNTAANRRFTFGVRGRAKAARHQFEGLIVFGIGLALTSGALAVLHSIGDPSPHRRTAGARARQSDGHRRPLRPAARLGVPPPPHRPDHRRCEMTVLERACRIGSRRPPAAASTESTRPRWARPALWALLPAPQCCTCGVWARRAGPTSSTLPQCRPARRTGRPLLFGSLDPGNAITVDKPPAALWVMAAVLRGSSASAPGRCSYRKP